MYCGKCGAEIPAGAKFCAKCGTPVPAHVAPAPAQGGAAPASGATPTPMPAASPAPAPAPQAPPASSPALRIGIIACVCAVAVAVGAFVWFFFLAPYPIDEATFPDVAVRTVVASTVDTDGNGEVSREEAGNVTDFTVDGAANLDGVGHFPNLKSLAVGGSALTSADVSPYGNLERFSAPDSVLGELDVSHNPNLIFLDVPDTTTVTGIEATPLQEAWLPVKAEEGGLDDAGEFQVTFDYQLERDAQGNPLTLVDTYHSNSSYTSVTTTTYAYDDAGRIVESVEVDDNSYSGTSSQRKTYGYDDTGRLSSVTTYYESGPSTANIAYDDAGKIASITHVSYTGEEGTTTFVYDENGHLIGMEGDPLIQRWFWDGSGRLSGFAKHYGDAFNLTNQMFTYDEQGNVVKVTLTPGEFTNSEYEKYGSLDFEYDVTYAYDEEGRIISGAYENNPTYLQMDEDVECTYDEAGRITQVTWNQTAYSDYSDARTSTSVTKMYYGRSFMPKDDTRAKDVLYLEPTYNEYLYDLFVLDPALARYPELDVKFLAAQDTVY